ncbi:MAG: nucleotidyltransferase domain-containing protein [Acidobacteria bacterium]|nr:nucleotidyltransferase domain-containing protein [Acidobacteriota bacterium]
MTREEATERITKAIVEHYAPEQVYLIGSTARGEARPDSDIDFVVVVPDDTPNEVFWNGEFWNSIRGIGYGVDIVPFYARDFEKRSTWLMSIPAIALREGRLLYEAKAVPA